MASEKDIQNQNKLNAGLEEQDKNLKAIKSLVDEILNVEELLTDEAIERAKKIKEISKLSKISLGDAKQLVGSAEKQRDLQEELNSKIEQEAINNSQIVKDQQKINDLYDKRVESEQKVNEYFGKFKNTLDDAFAVVGDLKVSSGLFAIALIDAASEFADTMASAADNIGISTEQAAGLADEMVSANIQTAIFGIGTKDNLAAMEGLADASGNLKDLTGDAAASAAILSKQLGTGAEVTGKLLGVMQLTEGATVETAKQSLETIGNLARGGNLRIGKVTQDVADNLELTSKFSNISVDNLGQMAVEAGKLGTNLTQLSALGDKLLNIDEARTNAMELSVLLGRQINIDRAQALAYEGDMVGAAKELLTQLGGIEAFNQMDVIQKQQAADFLGTSVFELEKQLIKQSQITATGERQATTFEKSAAFAQRMGGYLKENATVLLAGTNNALSIGKALFANNGLLSGMGSKLKGFAGKLSPKNLFGGTVDKTKEGFKKNFDFSKKATDSVKGGDAITPKQKGGGIKKGLQDLAAGLRSMGKGTFKGIAALALTGPALVLSLPAIPFLAFMGLTPLKMLRSNLQGLGAGLRSMSKAGVGALVMALVGPALALGTLAIPFLLFMSIPGLGIALSANFIALSTGLAAFGNPATAAFVLIGIGLLAALGVAMIPFAYSLSLITPLVETFGNTIVGVFTTLPPIIESVGNAISNVIGSIGGFFQTLSSIDPLQLFSLVPALGALGLAGVSMMVGAPGFIAMSAGIGMLAGALTLLVPLMPVMDKLASLGIIGPGTVEGGGAEAGGGGEDKSEVIANKLDELISVIREGGKVVMDGKEVGRVINLASGPIGG